MKEGLSALNLDDRVWNNRLEKAKDRPEHRDHSIYLTASKSQAAYYAKKAMNVDRARISKNRRTNSWELERLKNLVSRSEYVIKNPPKYEIENNYENRYHRYRDAAPLLSSKEEIDLAKAKIKDLERKIYYGQITLVKSEYKNLMADDDYLKQKN
jgi:23S rRNA G2445 N2-methylase RlmL